MKIKMAAMAAVLLVSSMVYGTSVPIQNPSFESYSGINDIPGWVAEGFAYSGEGDGATDGTRSLICFSLGVQQKLTTPIQGNNHYTFQVDIFGGTGQGGSTTYDGNDIFLEFYGAQNQWMGSIHTYDVDVYYGFDPGTFSSRIVNGQNTSPALIAGNTPVTNFVSNPPVVPNQWYTLQMEWDVPADSELAGTYFNMVLRSYYTSEGRYTIFDNVRLDATPLPEPVSLVMMGLGGLLLRRKNFGFGF